MPLVTMRDGQAVHVRVFGQGEPVLLLHGFGMESKHWLPFIWPFLHRFRFYMPDFRGAGPSSAAYMNQEDIFQNHMEDVQDIISYFGLQDFLLAGYSLGGSTALHLQRAGGFDGVRRYLHIDQTPCIGNREGWSHGLLGERQGEFFANLHDLHDILKEYPQFEQLGDLPLAVRQQAMEILGDTFSRLLDRPLVRPVLLASSRWPWLLSRIFPMSRLNDIRVYLSSYLSGGHDYRQSLPSCQVPVTVMTGMRSPLYAPAGQRVIVDSVPQGHQVRFEKSGHLPMVNEPVKFVRELGRFLHGG